VTVRLPDLGEDAAAGAAGSRDAPRLHRRGLDHAHERIERLERAIDQAIEAAPEAIRSVIEGLQSLRGWRASRQRHHR